MIYISSILSTLSSEEKREFDQFLAQKSRRGDAKNRKLLKLIESGKTSDLDHILYGKPSRNAYHALCKRLQDNLIDFVASKSFSEESSEEMQILKLLLASRIFFEHGEIKTAFKTLSQAERAANSLDTYSILNEIYSTKIQYAHLNDKLQLGQVISEAKKNMQLVQQEQQLNMAYAKIKARLKENSKTSVNAIIEEAFSDFDIQIDKTLTYKSLFQLMNLTTSAASLQSDYYEITPFVESVYDIIKEKQRSDKHLFYHIEILHLIAVTHFRNKSFNKSRQFTSLMETEMLKKDGTFYKRFSEKLTILKILNANYTGDANTAFLLMKKNENASLQLDLTFMMCLFQQGRYQDAYAIIKRNVHSDNWYEKKAGWIWVLKKNMIEILLLIELDKLDLVLSRLNSFKRKFYPLLREVGETRVITFMKLVSYVYERPEAVTSETFKIRVENSFEWVGSQREDIFVMSFYAWLKAKMEQKDLYRTTLELVSC